MRRFPRPARLLLVLFGLLLLGSSCVVPGGNSTARIEGQMPGECNDEADNDSDGYFDCLDSDCYGAPNCLNGDDDDDDDDDGDDDDTADDDDSAFDDDDSAFDDDTADDDDGDGQTPYIAGVTYVYEAAIAALVFSIEAYDPDENFGIPQLLWSVGGVAQPTVSVGSTPLGGTAWFDVQLDGVTAGESYSVLFAIQDTDGNLSEGHLLTAIAE